MDYYRDHSHTSSNPTGWPRTLRLPELLEEIVLGLDRFVHDSASRSEEDLYWSSLNATLNYLGQLGLAPDARCLEHLIVNFQEEVRVFRSRAYSPLSPRDEGKAVDHINLIIHKMWDLLRFLSELRITLEKADRQHLLPPPASDPDIDLSRQVTCSSDFRSINWYGTQYTFTPTQAACFRVLWESWQRGTPVLGERTILEQAESQSQRLIYLFDKGKHPAWGDLIVPGPVKGTFQLVSNRELNQ